MKLCYLTHMRLPTEKAYGVQMANMLESFSQEGLEVTLVGTYHNNQIHESVFDYYSLKRDSFKYIKLKTVNFFRNTRFGFWLNMISFCFPVLSFLGKNKHDCVFSREPLPLILLAFSKTKTIFEMHDFPNKGHFLYKLLCRHVDVIIATNTWAATKCVKEYGVDVKKVTVIPNGYKKVSCDNFEGEQLRKKHNISLDEKVVLYSGHLYDWKGVDTLAESAVLLEDIRIVFVGGNPDDVARMKEKYTTKNIIFVGHVKPEMVYGYLQMADILILPNVPINQHSKFSTSPIKLFEYMSSGTPVVASDLPSIRSIVDEKYVNFFQPGNHKMLAEAVRNIINDTNSTVKAIEAKNFVKQFSWRSRAKKIINLIQF